MPRDFTVAGLAHTLVAADRDAPVVLIRTPYGRHHHLAEAEAWRRRGFSCVVGDVRGRHGSAGRFRPYRNEAVDGATVVDALARLGFRRVIAAGSSYAAYCAVTAAIARPDAVVGVLAAVPALGLGETAREPGGAARLACRVGWWGEHAATAASADLAATPVVDLVTGWDDLWAAPARTADLWRALPRLTMPLLAVGGLHDPFAADTERLARCWGGPTRLVLGPWAHELDAAEPGAALAGRRIGALYLAWARALPDLRGDRAFYAVDGWRRHTASALPVALEVVRGEFRADPDRPFRSVPPGAPITDDPSGVLLTPPLPGGELRGGTTVLLDAVADAPDADWVIRLSHNGIQLAHAITRVRHRPGEPTRVALELPPVGHAVPAGARLRLEVAGHHWPRHARNPHTGEDPVRATRLHPSRRAVRHAGARLPWHPTGSGEVRAADLPEEIAS
ncbi:CocE/NonD family hydrolase [Actinosynnema sp. NPDC050436]|uniref:CocE/NonD family hydrolase n=1 Tax=Actinosynnema sp. NPDC050436 TaxID=3155659 RepID=UPI00340AF52F